MRRAFGHVRPSVSIESGARWTSSVDLDHDAERDRLDSSLTWSEGFK
jgi:hypothetical protein